MGQLFDSFSFFDGLEMEPVTQVNWANYWRGIIPDGVVSKVGNEMRPYANSTGMYVYVESGACVVDNHRGVNADMKIMAVDTSDPTYDRIDLIVARTVYGNENESFMEIDILTGTPALDPVVPALTQVTGTTYEIPLAEVYVAAGVVTLEASAVADRRNIFTAATQTVSFLNGDTVQLERGMLVWLDTENEDTVVRCPFGKPPIGVVTSETVAVGSRAQVATISGTIEEIRCNDNYIPLGAALIPSDTPGLATAGAGYGGGIALEEKPSGAVGNVRSLLAILSKIPALAPWYLPEGITEAMVIGAWQFIDRASAQEALININHGTQYPLEINGTGVTWSAAAGFQIGNAYSNGLNNATINALYSSVYSGAFGYTGANTESSNYRTGGITMHGKRVLVLRGYRQSSTYVNSPVINLNASSDRPRIAAGRTENGVLAGNWDSSSEIYRDGVILDTSTVDSSLNLLGTYNKTFGQIHVTTGSERGFTITAAVLYNVTLTADQHRILAENINALREVA